MRYGTRFNRVNGVKLGESVIWVRLLDGAQPHSLHSVPFYLFNLLDRFRNSSNCLIRNLEVFYQINYRNLIRGPETPSEVDELVMGDVNIFRNQHRCARTIESVVLRDCSTAPNRRHQPDPIAHKNRVCFNNLGPFWRKTRILPRSVGRQKGSYCILRIWDRVCANHFLEKSPARLKHNSVIEPAFTKVDFFLATWALWHLVTRERVEHAHKRTMSASPKGAAYKTLTGWCTLICQSNWPIIEEGWRHETTTHD